MKPPLPVTAALTVALLLLVVTARPASQTGEAADASQQFETAVTLLDSRGDARGAARIFEALAGRPEPRLAARALVYLGTCYERLRDPRAHDAYARVLRDFPAEAAAVRLARARLANLRPAAASRSTMRLRRFWDSPPAGLEVGSVSLAGRSMALFDAVGVVTLQDLRSGTARQRHSLLPAADTAAGCHVDGVLLAPDESATLFTTVCPARPIEVRWARFRAQARSPASSPATRVVYVAGPSEYVELLEWRRPQQVLLRLLRADRSVRLLLAPVDGQPARVVVTTPFVPAFASVSPDGKWIAYDGLDEAMPPRRDIFLVPADRGLPRAIVTGAADDLMPMWTPGGEALLFISDRTSTSGLWLQPVTDGAVSGAPRLLVPDLGRVTHQLGLTRDGTYVYFRQTGLVDVHVVPLDAQGQPAGPASTEGSRYVGATMAPTWSADGTQLAYRVELGVSRVHVIGMRQVSGAGVERILTPAMTWIDMPRWSPDGAFLLARGLGTTEGYGYFVIDVASGATRPLKTVPLMEEDTLGPAQWDRDGQAIVYARGGRLHRLEIADGRESVILRLPEGAHLVGLPDPGFAVSSFDGSIAYVQQASGLTSLHVMSRDGATREVVRAAPGERLAGVAWRPGNAALVFTRTSTVAAAPEESRWPVVWQANLRSGELRSLGVRAPRLRNLTVSPDGRRLAYTSGSPTREPWVAEHFLPSPTGARHAAASRQR